MRGRRKKTTEDNEEGKEDKKEEDEDPVVQICHGLSKATLVADNLFQQQQL